MIKLSELNTITYKDLKWIPYANPMSKIDKTIYSLSIKIRCKIYGHHYDYKKKTLSLCHGYLDDKCSRCGQRYWKLEDFDFWGGPKEFYERNKSFLSEIYWNRLKKELPELEAYK